MLTPIHLLDTPGLWVHACILLPNCLKLAPTVCKAALCSWGCLCVSQLAVHYAYVSHRQEVSVVSESTKLCHISNRQKPLRSLPHQTHPPRLTQMAHIAAVSYMQHNSGYWKHLRKMVLKGYMVKLILVSAAFAALAPRRDDIFCKTR